MDPAQVDAAAAISATAGAAGAALAAAVPAVTPAAVVPAATTAAAPAATPTPAASVAARRAPSRSAPHATPDLPASAADVTDQPSLAAVVTSLTSAITKAVHEGKSVTAGNKRLIACAAEEIRRAVHALAMASPPAPSPPAPTSTEAYPHEDGLTQIKRELMACVREEVGKLKAELSIGARPARPAATSAAIAASSAPSATDKQPSRSYAQALGERPARGPGAPSRVTPPPPAPRVSKPAIIVTTKAPTTTRQEVVTAFRKSISFKECKYAPVQVRPTSGNKLRVEFETDSQRDETLKRLRESNQEQVSAELARGLHPMIALKGIDKETPIEELTSVILQQNPALEGLCESDLTLKFKRNNRNSNLYNAVFVVRPKLFKAITGMGRVCIDHQRVHVEEFSPFLQCYTCLQFGHVRKNCPSKVETCEFCAETGHAEAACPAKTTEGASPKCFNCTKRNSKFETSRTNLCHKATSASCPVLRAMKARIDYRIDYGQAN